MDFRSAKIRRGHLVFVQEELGKTPFYGARVLRVNKNGTARVECRYDSRIRRETVPLPWLTLQDGQG